jgi:hypothetical protein
MDAAFLRPFFAFFDERTISIQPIRRRIDINGLLCVHYTDL